MDLEDKPPPVMRHQWIRGSIDDSQVDRALPAVVPNHKTLIDQIVNGSVKLGF